MVGILLLLAQIAIGSDCDLILQGSWYVAERLPTRLRGRILEVRFFSPDRSRWKEAGLSYPNLQLARPLDLGTRQKMKGLSPHPRIQPLQVGELTAVEGRTFTLERPRPDGSRKIVTFQEGIEWSADTNQYREIENRPLDSRDWVMFRTVIRPLFWISRRPQIDPGTALDSVEDR